MFITTTTDKTGKAIEVSKTESSPQLPAKIKKPRHQARHFYVHLRKVGLGSRSTKVVTRNGKDDATISRFGKGTSIVGTHYITAPSVPAVSAMGMLSPTGGATFVGIVTEDKRLIIKGTICKDSDTFCKRTGRREALRGRIQKEYYPKEWQRDGESESSNIHNCILEHILKHGSTGRMRSVLG